MKIFLWVCTVILIVVLLFSLLALYFFVGWAIVGSLETFITPERVDDGRFIALFIAIIVMWIGSVWTILLTTVIKGFKRLKPDYQKIRLKGAKLAIAICLRVFCVVLVLALMISFPFLLTFFVGAFGKVYEWDLVNPAFAAERAWNMRMMFVVVGIDAALSALLVGVKLWIKRLRRLRV